MFWSQPLLLEVLLRKPSDLYLVSWTSVSLRISFMNTEMYRRNFLLTRKISRDKFKALVVGIAAFVSRATIVNPKVRLSICHDSKDNMILECCLAAKADFLVTGDKDLLSTSKRELKKHRLGKLKMLTPEQFLIRQKIGGRE